MAANTTTSLLGILLLFFLDCASAYTGKPRHFKPPFDGSVKGMNDSASCLLLNFQGKRAPRSQCSRFPRILDGVFVIEINFVLLPYSEVE